MADRSVVVGNIFSTFIHCCVALVFLIWFYFFFLILSLFLFAVHFFSIFCSRVLLNLLCVDLWWTPDGNTQRNASVRTSYTLGGILLHLYCYLSSVCTWFFWISIEWEKYIKLKVFGLFCDFSTSAFYRMKSAWLLVRIFRWRVDESNILDEKSG